MLDFGFLPTSTKYDVQIFDRPCGAQSLEYVTWKKPRGVSMVTITCVGSGGGGGGGFTGIAGAARGGGGGGGSGSVHTITVPAFLLANILYVQPASGGRGGAANSSGTGNTTTSSRVNLFPGSTAAAVTVLSSNLSAGGGAAGNASGGGAGGAAGTLPAVGMEVGFSTFVIGQVGANGGSHLGGAGVAIAIPVTSVLTQGGSGGGGTTSADFAGGDCTAITTAWLSEQRPATPAAGSINGSGGPQMWKPFFSFGGLGGSSSNAGVGGNGGNGAFGSGGGGGGGGTTGGRGGDGGNGIIIIVSW